MAPAIPDHWTNLMAAEEPTCETILIRLPVNLLEKTVSWVRTHKIKQEVFGSGTRVITTAPLHRKEVIGVFSGRVRSFNIRA